VKLRAVLAVCSFAAMSAVTASSATMPGKLQAANTAASRFFVVTSVSATVTAPHGIWVRLSGGVKEGSADIWCRRASKRTAKRYEFHRAALFRLPIMPSGAESCGVIASVNGSGKVRVEIRAE
jgi:hypothetical protein